MKLGKVSASYDRRDLLMSRYLDTTKLPEIPDQFGRELVIPDWRMLGNDKVGDCVIAGGAHETMLLSTLGGNGMVFDEAHVLADYSAVTGYDPAFPQTDQGTNVREAMRYRQQTGLADFTGGRHKIEAYIALEPGNLKHLYAAMYLFGCVGVGLRFPQSAMEQFEDGQPWTVVPNRSPAFEGHYVSLVAKRRNPICVTWGRLQEVTETFLVANCDEAWAFVTSEYLQAGKTPEGFALQDLMSDLETLRA